MNNIDLGLHYTQNRELSWLKFNERVLDEAIDSTVPLVERLKFISIFSSNLDEFFMIRVGSLITLMDLEKGESRTLDPRSGLTYRQQLDLVYREVHLLNDKKDRIYQDVLKKLMVYGFANYQMNELKASEYKYLQAYFKEYIAPILSPQIIDSHHPFPHIPNKAITVACTLKRGKGKSDLQALIPVPHSLNSIVKLPGPQIKYVNIEKVILEFIDLVFTDYKVLEKMYFSVTRNGDISLDDEDEQFDIALDFRERMQSLLKQRKKLQVVRLEISQSISDSFMNYLCHNFKIKNESVFITETPMNLTYVFSLIKACKDRNFADLVYSDFEERLNSELDYSKSLLNQVAKKDILLSFPFESMESFTRMLKECIYDDSVVSIKITIYRVAKTAKIIDYLCMAAEQGKDVTALIELRARFDEQNNIDWSERLEEAGVTILYGFDGYKVHSKICLITRKLENGIQNITQIATGNYNENTAKLYTDLSLITGNKEIGKDANEFFKNMGIGNLMADKYRVLLVAPFTLKENVINLIKEEADKGSNGRIIIKMNSITDVQIIEALKKASCQGCKIDLIVRGICCILPQVKNATENITITQIVGRYLEHSRIYIFGQRNSSKVYISSSDFMTRNTEKRVEVACPIYDINVKNKIYKIIDHNLKDNLKARLLTSNGNYIKVTNDEKNNYDSQRELMNSSINHNFLKSEVPRESIKDQKPKIKRTWWQKLFNLK